MTETENYKLKMPEESDYVLPDPFNDNAVIIDAELKKAQDHREAGSAHITILPHTKAGTVHALTGLSGVTGTVSAVFTATGDYIAGDTITMDGESYTVQLSNGEEAGDNLFTTGVTIAVIVDTEGKKVNFKASGGSEKYAYGTITIAESTETLTISGLPFRPDGFYIVHTQGIYYDNVDSFKQSVRMVHRPNKNVSPEIVTASSSYQCFQLTESETLTDNNTYWITDNSMSFHSSSGTARRFMSGHTFQWMIWREE